MTLEELGGGRGDNTPLADEVDVIRLNEDREMNFATRSLLVERANKLAEALERLRGGEYGVCEECGEAIAPARLRAMPEVTTCVRCQDRLERMLPRLEAGGRRGGRRRARGRLAADSLPAEPGPQQARPVGDDSAHAPPDEPVHLGRLVDCPDVAAEPRPPDLADQPLRSTLAAGQMASTPPAAAGPRRAAPGPPGAPTGISRFSARTRPMAAWSKDCTRTRSTTS